MTEDRVSYSMGIKVNLGNYQSADVHISYSTDVKKGETPQQALNRSQKFVEDNVEEQHEKLTSIKA